MSSVGVLVNGIYTISQIKKSQGPGSGLELKRNEEEE